MAMAMVEQRRARLREEPPTPHLAQKRTGQGPSAQRRPPPHGAREFLDWAVNRSSRPNHLQARTVRMVPFGWERRHPPEGLRRVVPKVVRREAGEARETGAAAEHRARSRAVPPTRSAPSDRSRATWGPSAADVRPLPRDRVWTKLPRLGAQESRLAAGAEWPLDEALRAAPEPRPRSPSRGSGAHGYSW